LKEKVSFLLLAVFEANLAKTLVSFIVNLSEFSEEMWLGQKD